jgi:pimeloyl-ACP methyl ester carboxylesterase
LRAHQLLPGSRLELLDAGHFPHVEYPDEVTALILDLLGDSEPLTDRSAS